MDALRSLSYQLRKEDKLMTKIKKTKTGGVSQCDLYVRKYRNHPWEKYTGSSRGVAWTLGETAAVPETWTCKNCSVVNSKTRTVCLVCRSRNKTTARHAVGDWYCCLDSCLALNIPTNTSCRQCGTTRDAAKGELVSVSNASCKVILSNVSVKTTKDDITQFFSPLSVSEVVVETDKNGVFNKTMSVYFTSQEHVKEAIKKGGGTLRGRKVVLSVPATKSDRRKTADVCIQDGGVRTGRKRKRYVSDASEKPQAKLVRKESKWTIKKPKQ